MEDADTDNSGYIDAEKLHGATPMSTRTTPTDIAAASISSFDVAKVDASISAFNAASAAESVSAFQCRLDIHPSVDVEAQNLK